MYKGRERALWAAAWGGQRLGDRAPKEQPLTRLDLPSRSWSQRGSLKGIQRAHPTAGLVKPSVGGLTHTGKPEAPGFVTTPWDSSPSKECSPGVGAGERGTQFFGREVEGRAKCRGLCHRGVINTALCSQGHVIYRHSKPRAPERVCLKHAVPTPWPGHPLNLSASVHPDFILVRVPISHSLLCDLGQGI